MTTTARNRVTAVTADSLVTSGSGILERLIFSANGTVTAGVITVYDNTAESGTVIWRGTIQVATAPVTVFIGADYFTGIYVGYDGTIANVATSVVYRPA